MLPYFFFEPSTVFIIFSLFEPNEKSICFKTKPMYKETAYESSRPKYLYAFLNNLFVNLKTGHEYSIQGAIQGVIQGVRLW